MSTFNKSHQPGKEQYKAPLLQAMKVYAEDGAVAFHTPGHKQGLGAHPLLRELITDWGLRQEVSLMEELDDLHDPSMCIKEAQDLAAELYGADETLFMINGTTGAIHVMLMGTLNPGDTVLLPRNAHRSVIGGVILAGAVPVFIQPEIDNTLGIPMGLTVESVKNAVESHPDAKALLAVYPTYYGVTSELQQIAKILHENNMLLLVDEAHGPHLKFSEELPMQALDAGADVVAQSTHKIIGSMTQTSILHLKGPRVSHEKIKKASGLLQSTSPNYLLMASLDIARLQMAEDGKALLEKAVKLSEYLRNEINKIEGLWCFSSEYLKKLSSSGAVGLDTTKLTVSVRGLGISGVRAEEILRHKYKIQCELSDAYNVLFIISYADNQETADCLLEALRKLSEICREENSGRDIAEVPIMPAFPEIPPQGASPREAFFSDTFSVPFDEAEGKVSGETILFYPPGIPVLCPGDIVTAEIMAYIRSMQKAGLRVVGPEDTGLKTLRIVRRDSLGS